MLILNYHCFSSCYSNLDLYIYKWVNPFIRWNSKYNLVLHFMLGFFIKSVYWVSKQNQKSTRCDLDILSKSLSMLFDAQKCSMICNITKSCSLSHCTLSIIKIFFCNIFSVCLNDSDLLIYSHTPKLPLKSFIFRFF